MVGVLQMPLKIGHRSLTHVLTHTGLSHSGRGRFWWIHNLRVFCKSRQKALELQQKMSILSAHNPEVVGSSPASATKSVTVVDTISTTVIFYLFPFWGCFWKETGDISNISSHKQIVCPDLMRPWSEKTGLGKMTIVIRI